MYSAHIQATKLHRLCVAASVESSLRTGWSSQAFQRCPYDVGCVCVSEPGAHPAIGLVVKPKHINRETFHLRQTVSSVDTSWQTIRALLINEDSQFAQ